MLDLGGPLILDAKCPYKKTAVERERYSIEPYVTKRADTGIPWLAFYESNGY